MVDMFGKVNAAAYRRGVIALCRVSEADRSYLNSWSSGRIICHRDNGLSGIVEIDINMENAYYTGYGTNVSFRSNVQLLSATSAIDSTTNGFRPCTFKYGGIWYGGIEFCFGDANLGDTQFEGLGNFPVFGLDYYIRQTSSTTRQILNQEVYDSLMYDKWARGRDTWYS